MFDYTTLRRCRDSSDWLCRSSGGVELLVAGAPDGVDGDRLQMARSVMENIDRVQAQAIRLLESFMKDKGSWDLDYIDFGSEAARQTCDFQVGLRFVAESDPHAYGYTFFSVCFSLQEGNPPPLNTPHPFKFIVEFR
jgi:hypothetical protein